MNAYQKDELLRKCNNICLAENSMGVSYKICNDWIIVSDSIYGYDLCIGIDESNMLSSGIFITKDAKGFQGYGFVNPGIIYQSRDQNLYKFSVEIYSHISMFYEAVVKAIQEVINQ